MANAVSPQDEQKISEKQNTPWRVKFTCDKKNPSYQEIRKDLFVACWGNAKMVEVLFHFLNTGSWKAHHNHMDENTRVIVLQEKHSEILAKVKLKVSEPTLITFLKMFAQVGYVRKAARKGAQEINFEAVEKAFTNPPEKPVISKDLNLNLSLNSERSNEVDNLRQEVVNLREQVQDLSLTLVGFKSLYAQFEHEFKFNFSSRTKEFNLNESPESTQEASSDPLFFPKNPSLDIRDREEDEESKKDDCAIAPLAPTFFALLPWLWSDGLETPTRLLVELNSTMPVGEQQRRLWATEQYKQELASKGCPVMVEMVSEPPQNAIDAAATPEWILVLMEPAQPKQVYASYSQESPTPPEQSIKDTEVGAARGYMQSTDANIPSEQNKSTKRTRGKKAEKVEQSSLPFDKGIALNEDEQRISDWFCKFWFIKIPPTVNALYKKHCGTLVPFVHSWEEMQSLEKVARVWLQSQLKPGTKVGGLHLGNFTNTNVLNNWQPDLPDNIVAIDSKQRSGVDTFAHVPAFGGKTEEQLDAELPETLEFLRARGIAI